MKHLMQLLLLVGILHVSVAQEDPIVSTIYGDIRGSASQTFVGKSFEEFKGVPFAAPPLGDLRWRKPVPPESWDGVRDTLEFSKECTQGGLLTTSDDCLYLNVYVPGSTKDLVSRKEPLPVLVYVHGGLFLLGSASRFNGELLATNGEVIVVTTNYRVSTLGFFSTQSEAAPGNYGLWDQIAALEWVRDNIAAFGGDVSRVTVMGQSAGAASVSHLAISPEAKGLFQRVILLSGSSASYFGFTNQQRRTSSRLVDHFNCPTSSEEEAVDCLRDQSAFSLDLFGVIYPPLVDQHLFTQVPVVDGELVSVDPIEGLKDGLNAEYDLMTGLTLHDGAFVASPFSESVTMVNNSFYITFNIYENGEELFSLLLERYPDVLNEDLDTRLRALTKVITDMLFGARAFKEAELHKKTSTRSTYMYEFRHQYDSTDPSWLLGVHSEDLAFIFGRDNFDEDNARLSEYIQSYYSNFAHTGNPNEGPHSVPVEWPQFDPDTNLRLVERPDPFIETVPEEFLDDIEWANGIYDKIIPKKELDIENDSFTPNFLGIWETLEKEIEKSTRP